MFKAIDTIIIAERPSTFAFGIDGEMNNVGAKLFTFRKLT